MNFLTSSVFFLSLLIHRFSFQQLRNGSYYYNYTNPETGIIDAGIIDSWYENIIEGKYRYDFGNTFDNFCWVSRFTDKEKFTFAIVQ